MFVCPDTGHRREDDLSFPRSRCQEVPGVSKKTLQRFNLHFLSYYLLNLHIQHHFLNPHDLSFSKHPQLLSLDQPKAEKIEENYRVARNKTFWNDNCRFVNKPKILQKLSTLDQNWFEKDVYDGGYIWLKFPNT